MLRVSQKLDAHDGICWCVEWAPAGDVLASCGQDKKIKLWRCQDDELRCSAVLNGHQEVHSRTIRRVSWRGDSCYLAASSFDSTCSLWDVGAEEPAHLLTLTGQESEVKGVCFSPCGDLLATCSRDKSVWIFDVRSISTPPNTTQDASDSSSIEFQQVYLGENNPVVHSDDEEFMLASSPRVHTPATPGIAGDVECVAVLQGHSQDVKNIKFDPNDSCSLVSVSYDDTIRIWTCSSPGADDWELLETLRGHSNTVWDIAFDPLSRSGAQSFATVSADGTLKIWSSSRSNSSTPTFSSQSWLEVAGPLSAVTRLAKRALPVPVLSTSQSWSCQTITLTIPLDEGLPPSPLYSVAWQKDLLAVACGDNCVRVLQKGMSGTVITLATLKTDAEPNCVSWRPRKNNDDTQPRLAVALDNGTVVICELVV